MRTQIQEPGPVLVGVGTGIAAQEEEPALVMEEIRNGCGGTGACLSDGGIGERNTEMTLNS